MIIRPLIGGVLVEWYGETDGIRYAFIIATVLAIVSTIFQQWLITAPAKTENHAEVKPTALWKEMSAALKQLLFSDILIRFCEQIPYAFVVLWCVKGVGVTPVQFAELTTVEMLTALLIYIPVAHFADKAAKKPFIITTFIFFYCFSYRSVILEILYSFGICFFYTRIERIWRADAQSTHHGTLSGE